jgi:methylated-DNA-[protein]-cysteine S-methyltransferase
VTAVAPRLLRYAADGWGVGELWLVEGRPVWHELPRAGERDAADDPLVDLLAAYFSGRRVSLAHVELCVEWPTPFAERVADTLRAVPWGETVTYGELAALSGHPNAQRAVGSFCARNPVPLFVPCHRVVAADGVGPYGSLGVGYKRRLLALEGHAL